MAKKKLVRKKKAQLRMTAYLLDGKGGSLLVTVPVKMGSVPEEPKVILFERRAYIQVSTSPLSYENVLGGRAKRCFQRKAISR